MEEEYSEPYWNGKMSDHPMIQKMIRVDNEKFQSGRNKYEERSLNWKDYLTTEEDK